MGDKYTIEVDAGLAEALQVRARQDGITVDHLVNTLLRQRLAEAQEVRESRPQQQIRESAALWEPVKTGLRPEVRKRIVVNPHIHFGKPCVAGTRIPVQSVLELVNEGLSFERIIREYYPDLQVEDIQACIQYAIDVLAAEELHVAVVSV